MFIQNFGKIGKLEFNTMEKMNTEQAREYAMQKLRSGSCHNCTIGKVYVNGKLVLENVKTS